MKFEDYRIFWEHDCSRRNCLHLGSVYGKTIYVCSRCFGIITSLIALSFLPKCDLSSVWIYLVAFSPVDWVVNIFLKKNLGNSVRFVSGTGIGFFYFTAIRSLLDKTLSSPVIAAGTVLAGTYLLGSLKMGLDYMKIQAQNKNDQTEI